MGASKSKPAGCSDGCLGGLSPASRRRNNNKVTTLEQALRIGRQDEGSWQPSFHSPSANVWASPVPRGPRPPIASDEGEIEVVIEDLGPGTVQVDSDWGPYIGCRPASKKKDYHSFQRNSKFAVEQLLFSPGSLPKPLAPETREAAIRELQPTATYEMLAKVPREFLEGQGPEAQNLRRSLVRGATVVFASAGYPGKRFIFEHAAALGVKSVILDHPDSWSRELVAEGIVAKFLPVDMSQSSEDVYREATKLIRQLGEDGTTGPVDAITTFVELSVPLAARLCESFGLPGFRPAAVDAARDKHQTRAALKRAGLPTPKNFLIKKETDLMQAAQVVGFPAVLKPVSGAASLGVKKVVSLQELTACYREVHDELNSLVVSSGALVKASNAGGGVTASEVVDLTLLLEQYLDGSEVDIDVVMSEGQWQYAAVADNGPTLEPYFNETWGLCPSKLPQDQQRELKDLAVKSVEALGFSSGVFHVECKYTTTGPQLIEVNARMGGGPVREVNRLVWGVDLVEEAIFIALGIPARPLAPEKPNTCIGYCFVNAKKSGKLVNTESILALRKRDGVVSADPLVAPGDDVVSLADGMPTWVALLVVKERSSLGALDFVLKLEKEMPVEIIPRGNAGVSYYK